VGTQEAIHYSDLTILGINLYADYALAAVLHHRKHLVILRVIGVQNGMNALVETETVMLSARVTQSVVNGELKTNLAPGCEAIGV
jgi:hypothetical protein